MYSEIVEMINKSETVYIYGAGERAKLFIPICETYRSKDDIKVIVTDTSKDQEVLCGYGIMQYSQVTFSPNDVVFLALGEQFWKGISDILGDKCKVYGLEMNTLRNLRAVSLKEQLYKLGIDCRLLPSSIGISLGVNKEGYGFLDERNIVNKTWEISLEESAKFVIEYMDSPTVFYDLESYSEWLMKECVNCDENAIGMEFGVYKGASINRFSSMSNMRFFGFDSFEGLPEDWIKQYERGRFFIEGLPMVNENVTLVKGWFDESLPLFLQNNALENKNIQFIHIDCDLYSSTKTVFSYLSRYIKAGTIIAFDEFFNYPGWKKHEYKAFMEWVKEKNISFEYIAYVATNSQVAVRIL